MALKRTADNTALHRVAEREYARDLPGLLAQLADSDSSVRRWAARDLAGHAQGATALCARLTEETDASVRAVLFSSALQLGATQGATVVQAMMELLRSEDAALRNGAIEVLAGLPDAVAPHIDHLLHDADGDVRIFTVNLLGDLRHPKVPQWLAQVLQQEQQVNVVGAALEVLVEVGGPEALPALRSAQQRFAGNDYIGFSAALAIERIEST